MSEAGAKFCWLFSPGVAAPLDLSEFEWRELSEIAAKNWQVLPTTLPRLRRVAEEQRRELPNAGALSDLSAAATALAAAQNRLLLRYVFALMDEGIPYTLLKGSAMRFFAYEDATSRAGLDVDVAVPQRFLKRAELVLKKQGFVAASLDDTGRHFFPVDEATRATFEESHYELVCFVRRQVIDGLSQQTVSAISRALRTLKPWHLTPDGEAACYVTIDVHHGLCLDIDAAPAVESAVLVPVDGGQVRVPTPEWLLLHIIFKLYWEGVHAYRKGLYQYSDLVRLAPRVSPESARALIGLLQRYELEAAGYYVLRRLPQNFAVPLVPTLEEFVHQGEIPPGDVFPDEVNDHGDMWSKLWGRR